MDARRGRFAHHMLVENEMQLDAQLMAWIAEVYAFALSKR